MTDYSKTTNLPSTKFSMKANLSKTEMSWIDFWQDKKIIEKKKKSQKKRPNLFFMTVRLMQMATFT